MALTDDDYTLLRSYVTWDPPTRETLDTRFDVLGTWQATALEAVRTKRNELIANPASFSVSGEYSESWGENMRLLSEMMVELGALIPAGEEGATVGQAKLVRADRGTRGR